MESGSGLTLLWQMISASRSIVNEMGWEQQLFMAVLFSLVVVMTLVSMRRWWRVAAAVHWECLICLSVGAAMLQLQWYRVQSSAL